jgi:hypothetical protein
MSETDYGLFALIAPKQFIPTIMARTKHTLKPINDVITDFCVFMSVQVVDEIFGGSVDIAILDVDAAQAKFCRG